MRNQTFEIPFIAFYRKEEVCPELNIRDLWKIYRWDEKVLILNINLIISDKPFMKNINLVISDKAFEIWRLIIFYSLRKFKFVEWTFF